MATLSTRIQLRNDTLANWQSESSLSLSQGEMAIAIDDGKAEIRIGTGNSKWGEAARLKISADQVVDFISQATSIASTEVNALSTYLSTVGFDTVNTTNKIATMADIAGLEGAMHFKDAVTPSEGQSDLDAIAEAVADPIAGDVVIVTTSSKEYVYSGTAWVELGDESLYATKAEVNGISSELTADIGGLATDVSYLSGQIDATNATLNTVSSDYLKAADKTELTGIINTVSAETLVSANAYTDDAIATLTGNVMFINCGNATSYPIA